MRKKLIKLFATLLNTSVHFDLDRTFGYLKIIEHGYGHALSREKQQSVDANDSPVPWFTYAALEYLKQLNLKEKSIFEWGSGNSSLFFCSRTKEVYSIESDKTWFERISSKAISNHHIYYREGENYESSIKTFQRHFDIIIIDGIRRKQCADLATNYLSENGMIILDNSDRNPDIAKDLRRLGYIQVDMHGLGPINHYCWTTSFFLTRKFDFEPIDHQPIIPIGGGY